MARLHYEYPVQRAMRGVTICVDVTGVRTWRLRLWLGRQLIQLAALVMGCAIRFDGIEQPPRRGCLMKPWHMTTYRRLGLRDRLRVLIGWPVFVRFTTPDEDCSAAGSLSVSVQRAWPADADTLDCRHVRYPLPDPPPRKTT